MGMYSKVFRNIEFESTSMFYFTSMNKTEKQYTLHDHDMHLYKQGPYLNYPSVF